MTDQNCGSILVAGKRKHAYMCRCSHARSVRKPSGHLPHTYTRSTLNPGDPQSSSILWDLTYSSESNEPRPTTVQSSAMVQVEHPRKKEMQVPQRKCAASAPVATHPNCGISHCLIRVPPHHPCLAHVVPGCCRMAAWSLQPQQWSDVEHWDLAPHLGKQCYRDCLEGLPVERAAAGNGTSVRPR